MAERERRRAGRRRPTRSAASRATHARHARRSASSSAWTRARGSGTLYNAILTFGPDGALLNHHRKLVPTYTERMVWGQGDADGLARRRHAGRHALARSCAGSTGCRSRARRCTSRARTFTSRSGRPCTRCIRSRAASTRSRDAASCSPPARSCARRRCRPSSSRIPRRCRTPEQWVMRGGSAIIGPDGALRRRVRCSTSRRLIVRGPRPRPRARRANDARRHGALPSTGCIRLLRESIGATALSAVADATTASTRMTRTKEQSNQDVRRLGCACV